MLLSHLATLFIALFACINACAQSFKAHIEDVGGYYRLTFTVTSTNVKGFTPPSLSAFEVLSGPSIFISSDYRKVNGRASHNESTTYTYILSVRESGQITIGAASVQVNGRTLHSRPIRLHAQSGGNSGTSNHSSASQNNTSYDQLQQAGSKVTQHDLFIDVTPSRTKVYEQEAILLTYRIHARVGVGLSNTSLVQKPDFKGLISQELPLPGNQIQTTLEHRNGAAYRTGTILQYLVFPQHSGSITIPSITFDCAVVQQDHTMNLADAFFNGGGTIGVQVRRSVAPLKLQVSPLPMPRPANFSGAVGKFNIQGELLNSHIKTNDVATYRITLNGLGNLKLITAPTVNFPKDFDTFDAKTTDNTKVSTDGLHGQLTFDYTFVPRNVGDYTIPATDFVFFDSATGTYRTIRTSPVKLHISKGSQSNADVDKQLALLKSDIRKCKPTEHSSILAWGSTSYVVLNILLIVISIVLWILVNIWNRKQHDTSLHNNSRAYKNAMRTLRLADPTAKGQENGKYYSTISQAIDNYLATYFGLQKSDMNKDSIRHLLQDKHIDDTVINNLFEVTDYCQYAEFAPNNDADKVQTLAKAKDVIKLIDDALKNKA